MGRKRDIAQLAYSGDFDHFRDAAYAGQVSIDVFASRVNNAVDAPLMIFRLSAADRNGSAGAKFLQRNGIIRSQGFFQPAYPDGTSRLRWHPREA